MSTAHAAPADLSALSDDALSALVADVAGDDRELERVLAELDRRDGLDAAAAVAAVAPDPAEEEGPPLTAEEERRAYLAEFRRPGESIVKAADRLYGEITYARYEQAEKDTRGMMRTREGESAGIDTYSLFHGNAARAMKWASDELLDWWEQHGRVTWAEHMAEWTGYSRYATDAERARGAWQDAVIRGRKRRASPGEYRAPRVAVRKFGARED